MALLNNFSLILIEPQFLLSVFHKLLCFRDGKQQGSSVARMCSSRPQESNCTTMHPSGLKGIRCMMVHGMLCNSAYMIDCLLRKVKGLLNHVITTIHHRTGNWKWSEHCAVCMYYSWSKIRQNLQQNFIPINNSESF